MSRQLHLSAACRSTQTQYVASQSDTLVLRMVLDHPGRTAHGFLWDSVTRAGWYTRSRPLQRRGLTPPAIRVLTPRVVVHVPHEPGCFPSRCCGGTYTTKICPQARGLGPVNQTIYSSSCKWPVGTDDCCRRCMLLSTGGAQFECILFGAWIYSFRSLAI